MTKTDPRKKTAPRKTPRGPSRSGPTPRRSKRKPKAHAAQGSTLFRAITGIVLLVLIVVATGLVVRHFFPPGKEPGKGRYEVFPQDKPHDQDKKDEYPGISIKEKPELDKQVETDDDRPEEKPRPDLPPDTDSLPEVAIIIDDIGYDRPMVRKFAAIDPGLTFSILPHSPHRREIAAYARRKGIEIMLHLPMEPVEYPRVNPGPGALLTSMDVDTMIETLNDDLDSVPYIVGVNNHMGSRMTAESTRMYQIFTVLKKRDLFFIDSRTAFKTVCKPSAELLQIPFGERDVFLDHSQNRETIRQQIRKLIRIAEKKGSAIGIGHPHTETLEILTEEYPGLISRVRIVHASELVKHE